MFTIRRCQTADVPDVQHFLDAHWKRGHIFSVDRELFDWQYARPDRPGEYAIVLARRDADNAVAGMLGFIPTSRFDPALSGNTAIWLALWRVRDDIATGALGLRLLSDVVDREPHTSIGVIGFQPTVDAIYSALKFQIGELQHYVLPNPDVSTFQLASFARRPARSIPASDVTAERVDEQSLAAATAGLDLGSRAAQLPQKTADYVRERYLRHPRYRYSVFVLRRHHPIGLLVARVATHGGRRALRLVDYIGPDDAVPSLGALIADEIRRRDCEYADVQNWGIDPSLFEAAGFSRVDPAGPDIVPNHFEPFERRNAPVRFALRASRPTVLFKGDGDQDRPNQGAAS
jgi:hypothetical protein